MKIKHFAAAVLLGLGCLPGLQAQTYDQLWKQTEEAAYLGKPQTAIQLATTIFEKAEKEKNSAQMLKAYIERSNYRNSLTPDSFYVNLQNLEQWAATTEKPLDRAILHSVIAEIYADYAQDNQWQLRQRKDIVNEDPALDLREWSGNMFVQRVLMNTREALKDTDLLLNTATGAYVPFVKQGTTSSYYKHDMYHLLGSRGVNALEMVKTLDNDTQVKNEVEGLYQQMISVYRKTGNEEALVLVSLDYLTWKREGNSESTREKYLAELDKLIAQYQLKDVCAEVYLAKAQMWQNNDQHKALQACEEAIKLYPSYKRINALKQLKQQIQEPDLTVYNERTAYPGSEFTLNLRHRNLDGLTVAFYRLNTGSLPSDDTVLNDAYYKRNTSKVSEQHFDLVRTADYMTADTMLKVKAPVEGCYVIRVVPDEKVERYVGQFIYVTRFTVLSRTLPQNQSELVVLDSQTGQPVANANIGLYSYDKKLLKTVTTGADGKVVTAQDKNDRQLRVWKGTDKWMPYQSVYTSFYEYDKGDKPLSEVKLLTDRGLYRPGQTVHVKGIAYTRQLDISWVSANKKYIVKLLDVNRQEVAQKEVRTNEFGSFTTTFTLPSVCLNGFFTLQTENGEASIKVEEYKRPTFDITFDKLEGSYKLGDGVQVKGHAKTFSGVAMTDLSVEYVVSRSYGFDWRMFGRNSEVIDSGTAKLDANGAFSVPVLLKDKGDGTNKSMNYRFQVEATLTNAAGETQTSTYSLTVGERSLFLEADLGGGRISKDNPIKATFKAVNLDGQPVSVEGTYGLYPMVDAKHNKYAEQAIHTGAFTSNRETTLPDWQSLPSGAYELILTAKDAQGREVKDESTLVLLSVKDTRPATETPLWYYEVNTEFDATHPAEFYLGTSFEDTYVLMTVITGDKVLENKSLVISDSIVRFEYAYKEEYGNGLTVNFCFVRDNQIYQETVSLRKRISDKTLTLKWDVFRDKLRPGQQEEWKLTVKNAEGLPATAELLALMYDASLDKIYPHRQALQVFYGLNLPYLYWEKTYVGSNYYDYWFRTPTFKVPGLEYDHLDININRRVITMLQGRVAGVSTRSSLKFVAPVMQEEAMAMNDLVSPTESMQDVQLLSKMDTADRDHAQSGGGLSDAGPALRTNFSETAFFFPQLQTNEQGEIAFSFMMPESLTRWNFRGYAHTKGMLTGMIDSEVTTSKEFMLTPNLPRFVRVGDRTSVAASVVNLTGHVWNGTVELTLFDPLTETVISTQKQKFAIDAGQTTGVNFQFTATDKYEVLGCRIIADGGLFSDGEQHLLPVLSNKEVLVETVALPIRGQKTQTFSLEKLFNNHSKTATNRQLTVEFTANPVWYAVQALPALSQPTHDNAVSWATAYYANTLAAYIMNSQPRIKAVFDSWKLQGGTKETFLSSLQKNQEVKNILLSESPWVMEAKNEQQQKERIATLFDLNTISNNQLSARTKLKELQLPDGSWPWYKGMNGSEYITTYIAGLNARLTELTGNPLEQGMLDMQTAALTYMNKQAKKAYEDLRKQEKEGGKITGISSALVDYLYVQTLSGATPDSKDMQQYFLNKAAQMVGTASMKTKAKLAVVFDRLGRKQEAQRFMVSLKEHLTKSDELGMYFAFNESPYAWNGQPVPAHVSVMEAFDRVAKDTATVDEMKFWLLKQKQTQQWDSPVATADAVYALLERGSGMTDVQGGARLTFGGKVLDTEKSRMANVGYIKEIFTDKRAVDAKEITVAKRDKGIAWGAVYARFEENIDQVQQQGGELNIEKKLYVERLVNNVRQLEPVTAQSKLKVGDKVVSRITIRTDRGMEFVQLKDQRGACFEPIENLSGYRWGNGFGYYVDVKDASTNFFFDGLGKGVFVLEYAYRVARTGTYDAGLATIQCAYAPEYASHSAAMTVVSE